MAFRGEGETEKKKNLRCQLLHLDHAFKMRLIRDETAMFERFLSWLNSVFTAIWNMIFALEQFFHIATKAAIATETAF